MVETAICSQKYRKVVFLFFAQIAILFSVAYLKTSILFATNGLRINTCIHIVLKHYLKMRIQLLMCSLSQVLPSSIVRPDTPYSIQGHSTCLHNLGHCNWQSSHGQMLPVRPAAKEVCNCYGKQGIYRHTEKWQDASCPLTDFLSFDQHNPPSY